MIQLCIMYEWEKLMEFPLLMVFKLEWKLLLVILIVEQVLIEN